MTEFDLICPHCKQRLKATQEMLGTTIECTSCQGEMTLPIFPPSFFQRKAGLPPPLPTRPGTSPLATVSLVLAICGLCTMPLGIALAIPAVICAIVARRNIRQGGGKVTGSWVAFAALILAWFVIALSILMSGGCLYMLRYYF